MCACPQQAVCEQTAQQLCCTATYPPERNYSIPSIPAPCVTANCPAHPAGFELAQEDCRRRQLQVAWCSATFLPICSTTEHTLPTNIDYITHHHDFHCHPAGFELVEEDCRKLQGPELDKCLMEGCKKDKKDCTAVGKKCDDSFKEGTMLAAWCRQEEGC